MIEGRVTRPRSDLSLPMNETFHYRSIAELSQLLQARKVSPVEIIDACLARIDTLGQRLNTFATVLADEARESAREAEAEIKAGHWRGPLHGLPVGIKDFYDLANIRTTAAFEGFKNRVPRKDAAGVTKLKDAGAIAVGKMNMHRLGMGTTGLDSYFGPVRNPGMTRTSPAGHPQALPPRLLPACVARRWIPTRSVPAVYRPPAAALSASKAHTDS